MISFDRFTDLSGRALCGFFVRRGDGKIVALGATGPGGFVQAAWPRYGRDVGLMRAVERLVGMPIRPLPRKN